MVEIVNKIIADYTEFIVNKVSSFTKHQNVSGIFSYVIELPVNSVRYDPIGMLEKFEISFFFQDKKSSYQITSYNSILWINENGKERFARIDKRLKSNFPFVMGNWANFSEIDFPLFVGGMKFAVEHSDGIWNEFSDTNWHIPEFLIYKNAKGAYLVYNSIFEGAVSVSSISKKLNNFLLLFFGNSKHLQTKPVRVNEVLGNGAKEKKKWSQKISQIKSFIETGAVQKVVLSRRIDLVLSEAPTISFIISELQHQQDGCFVYLIKNKNEVFFGASPELLFSIKDKTLHSEAIAGTAPRSEKVEEDDSFSFELLNSAKDREEHLSVLSFLTDSLKAHTEDLDFDPSPVIKKFRNVQHLYSEITAKVNNSTSLFCLMEKVFPSPAVCGYPKESSLNIIKKIEEHNRGLYAGVIGWFNLQNSCEFAVGIRSAVVTEKKLSAFAGCGIMADSAPDAEYDETNLKFKTILSLFKK